MADKENKGKGTLHKVAGVVAVIMALYHIMYIGHVFEYFDIYIMVEVHRSLHIAFVLALVYLLFPANKGSRIHRYQILLVFVAIAVPLYFAFNANSEFNRWNRGSITGVEVVMGVVEVILLLEAARRTLGLSIALIAAFFFLYAMYGNYFPGFLEHRGFSLARVINTVSFSTQGLPGIITGVSARIIIMFVLFGVLLIATGAGDFFINLAFALMGKYRGGPAKVAIVASMFFGTISGSSTANAVTTGSITIPLMKRVGYKPHFAAAVETVASNGGAFTPPVMGAVAFIMAEWLGISYWSICLAAAVPAIIYYVCLYLYVDIEAMSLKLQGVSSSELPSFKKTIREGFIYIIPVVLLVYFIAVLMYPAEVAALYCIILTVIISLFRKKTRLGPKQLFNALKEGATAVILPAVACITAEVIVSSIMLTGMGPKLTSAILTASGGNMFLILSFTAITCFVLGMGMGTIPIYMILASLVAPSLVKLGVPALSAHLFVLWWGLTAHITPPVAVTAFAASAIAESSPMRTGFTASRLGMLTYMLPFIWVYQPSLLLMGSALQTLSTVLITLVLAVLLCYSISGFMLKWWQRVLLLGGAGLMLTFNWIFVGMGIAIGLIVFATYRWSWVQQRLRLTAR